MSQFTALIIDDVLHNVSLLEQYLKENCPNITVIGKGYSKKEAVLLIDKLRPQIIFLDIVLEDGTGFDVLDEISVENIKVIFVTAFDNYAIKAFKYNAIDYLLKPLKTKELVAAVSKVEKEIELNQFTTPRQIKNISNSYRNKQSNFNLLAIPSMNKIEFFKLSDILYLRSEGRYTSFYLTNGQKVLVTKNIGDYDNTFSEDAFFRVHHGYIVNLSYVEKIIKETGFYCQMKNGDNIPISKRKQEELFEFIGIK